MKDQMNDLFNTILEQIILQEAPKPESVYMALINSGYTEGHIFFVLKTLLDSVYNDLNIHYDNYSDNYSNVKELFVEIFNKLYQDMTYTRPGKSSPAYVPSNTELQKLFVLFLKQVLYKGDLFDTLNSNFQYILDFGKIYVEYDKMVKEKLFKANTLDDLFEYLRSASLSQIDKMSDYNVIFRDDQAKFFIIKVDADKGELCKLGENTNWCTAKATRSQMPETYRKGTFYLFLSEPFNGEEWDKISNYKKHILWVNEEDIKIVDKIYDIIHGFYDVVSYLRNNIEENLIDNLYPSSQFWKDFDPEVFENYISDYKYDEALWYILLHLGKMELGNINLFKYPDNFIFVVLSNFANPNIDMKLVKRYEDEFKKTKKIFDILNEDNGDFTSWVRRHYKKSKENLDNLIKIAKQLEYGFTKIYDDTDGKMKKEYVFKVFDVILTICFKEYIAKHEVSLKSAKLLLKEIEENYENSENYENYKFIELNDEYQSTHLLNNQALKFFKNIKPFSKYEQNIMRVIPELVRVYEKILNVLRKIFFFMNKNDFNYLVKLYNFVNKLSRKNINELKIVLESFDNIDPFKNDDFSEIIGTMSDNIDYEEIKELALKNINNYWFIKKIKSIIIRNKMYIKVMEEIKNESSLEIFRAVADAIITLFSETEKEKK